MYTAQQAQPRVQNRNIKRKKKKRLELCQGTDQPLHNAVSSTACHWLAACRTPLFRNTGLHGGDAPRRVSESVHSTLLTSNLEHFHLSTLWARQGLGEHKRGKAQQLENGVPSLSSSCIPSLVGTTVNFGAPAAEDSGQEGLMMPVCRSTEYILRSTFSCMGRAMIPMRSVVNPQRSSVALASHHRPCRCAAFVSVSCCT